MTRTAEYAIKGFIYQFLLTISKLLENNDAEITVEGIVEDVDVTTPSGIEAFQCKYHETKNKFTLSTIYKPILQMLCHFQKNATANIKYRLHAHFPNETVGTIKTLTVEEIKEVLLTTATNLQSYTVELSGFTKIEQFLKCFEIQFGSSYDDMESSVIVALSKEGFSTEDVKDIFYPNAVHKIAETSLKQNIHERKIKKSSFLEELKSKKKTAISRWTKELQSYKELLKKRREQLRDNLNKNYRSRCVVIDENFLVDFDTKIVQIIEDFVDKFNSKVKNACPTFILNCSDEKLNSIWKSLLSKKIDVERGHRAGAFDQAYFLREPMKNIKENKAEFRVRIARDEDFEKILPNGNFDDLFFITKSSPRVLENLPPCNIELLATEQINELRYLLSLNTNL